MERLEPILKQKFWILMGIGMIMTIVGWWIATSTMAAQIVARTGEIKTAFGKVPEGQIPNDSWASQLAARNREQDLSKQNTARILWERQKDRMTWPNSVAEFAWANGYRGEIALTGRENYRTAYSTDVHRVWEVVRPYDPLNGSGIVYFGSPQAEMLPQQTWGVLAPSSAEMWDAQEDLWLLESILQSITDLNGGPNGERLDAAVHVIEKLELHGGTPGQKKSSSSAAPASGKGGAAAGAHSGGGSGAAAMGFGGLGGGEAGGMGSGRGGSEPIGSADFDWKEEFGDDGSSGSRSGAGGVQGGMPGPAMGATAMAGPGGAAKQGASGASPASGGSKVRRYIEDDAALPYKTRGFYMTVLMDHRRIPSLIAELTSSDRLVWPVEIVRVQMARIHDDDIEGGGLGGPGGAGGGRSGGGLSSLMSARSGAGGGSLMSEGGGVFGGASSGGFGGAGRDRAAGGASSTADAANVALETALSDPVMARVALCGIITLYREVKPDPKAQVVVPAVAPTAPKVDQAPTSETSADSVTATSESPEKANPESPQPGSPAATAETPAADAKPAEVKPAEVKPAEPNAQATEPK